jgi:hypothetical protein
MTLRDQADRCAREIAALFPYPIWTPSDYVLAADVIERYLREVRESTPAPTTPDRPQLD